jgi:hypothetical protein
MVSYTKDITALEKFLSTKSDKVRENTKIITPTDVGYEHLIHISCNTKIKEFIPRMPVTAAPSEDSSVPRICCSPSVQAAMMGYSRIAYEYLYAEQDSASSKGWKSGYLIYGIPFKAALSPNNKLVYDAQMTSEYWLVPYSEDTSTYEPVVLGKMFLSQLTYKRTNERVKSEMEIYLECKDISFAFNSEHTVTQGYYRILMDSPEHIATYKNTKRINLFEQIDKASYLAQKKVTASLLSHSLLSNWK